MTAAQTKRARKKMSVDPRYRKALMKKGQQVVKEKKRRG